MCPRQRSWPTLGQGGHEGKVVGEEETVSAVVSFLLILLHGSQSPRATFEDISESEIRNHPKGAGEDMRCPSLDKWTPYCRDCTKEAWQSYDHQTELRWTVGAQGSGCGSVAALLSF